MNNNLFSTLDNIDWENLEHIYGSAEIIPQLLRELVSDDPEEAYEAYEGLYDLVWMPEVVSSATPKTIPFIIEIVDKTDSPMRNDLIEVLSDLMFDLTWSISAGIVPVDDLIVQETINEIRAGLPSYFIWAQDQELQTQTLNLLDAFHSDCSSIAPVLLDTLDYETDPMAQYRIVNALVALFSQASDCPDVMPYIAKLREFKTSDVNVLKYIASVGLIQLKDTELSDSYAIIQDAIVSPEKYVLPGLEVDSTLMMSIRMRSLELVQELDPAQGMAIIEGVLENLPEDEGQHTQDEGVGGLVASMEQSLNEMMSELEVDEDDELEDGLGAMMGDIMDMLEASGLDDMMESPEYFTATNLAINLQYTLMKFGMGDGIRAGLENVSTRELPSGEMQLIFEPVEKKIIPLQQSPDELQLKMLELIQKYDLFWIDANNLLEVHGFPQDRDELAQYIQAHQ